jgi:hypothetical protein
MAICGAKTKGGKQCQRRVSEAGQHCSLHTRTTPRAMLSKILGVCGAIETIAKTAEGVVWIYQHAWPYIEPVWQSGWYCPERFWWDSLALPVQRGESAAEIHSNLKAVLAQMRTDNKGIEDRLARHSERERERIADAYSKVLSEIRTHYSDLADAASGIA